MIYKTVYGTFKGKCIECKGNLQWLTELKDKTYEPINKEENQSPSSTDGAGKRYFHSPRKWTGV